MTKMTKLSTALLTGLCLAALLPACQPAAPKPAAPKSETSQTMPKDTSPALETHLYLEEVLGEQALAKVEGWNARTLGHLEANPLFAAMQAEALEILNSKDKIPYVSYRGGEVHNFWQDAQHVRGVWRKSTLESYLSDNPKWETVLDIDALAKAEDKNWVYKGNNCLSPDYALCMVSLSDGGKDAVVNREFNTQTKSFVQTGFVTAESKGGSDWLDKDTQVIGIDFGTDAAGPTMTDSGYPMVSKLWSRGTPLSEAKTLMRGETSDVGVWPGVWELSDGRREILITRAKTFYESEFFWLPKDSLTPVKLPVPEKAEVSGEFKGQVLLKLNEDWRGYVSGDLVSFSIDDFMQDGKIETVNLVYHPTARSSIGGFGATKSKLLMSIYENVQGRAFAFDWVEGKWVSSALDFPAGTVSIGATNDKEDVAFVSTQGFLTPNTLWTYNSATGEKTKAKALPDWFDASNMVAEQFESTSKDGTKVPYFVVRSKDTKMDGTNPRLLYGYGGFEVSLNPSYSATRGKLWIERGGVYVLANIRGGGEFGPNWHQAGLKTNRQRIYDDFISVAEDLIAKDLTSPAHLGIEGGSNGGLLMGVMFTQRPELFNAVVCAVPLLDMQRYHTLLAGASWVGEYGDPEDTGAEGAFIRALSPYHNVKPGVKYPEVFFVTSTKDDRVHPAHARKMAARFEDLGVDFLYYENIDGGHGAAANLKETARRLALQHTYLFEKLGGGDQ